MPTRPNENPSLDEAGKIKILRIGNKKIAIDSLEIVSTDTRHLVRTAAEIERGKNYPQDDARWQHPNLKPVDVINGWIPVYDESMGPLFRPHIDDPQMHGRVIVKRRPA